MPSTIRESQRRTAQARQAVKYWTNARMESAIPIPLREAPRSLMQGAHVDGGRTRVVQPVMPKSQRKQLAQTNEVGDITQFPYSCVGKLFMREGSSNYVASAWVIGDQAIFSAAHCLFDDNGTFFDDVIFHPQYRNGSSLGAFAVVQSSVDNRYTNFDDDHLKYDMGIGILDRPIGNLTGIMGYAVNPTSQIAIGQKVTAIGYPAGAPFDGTKMFQSKGKVVRDSNSGTTLERFYGAENEMTGGCSGGPWVDENNIVVGLNSFVFVGEQPQIMHSPYFGQGFENLIEWASENGGMADPSGGGSIGGGGAGTRVDLALVRNQLAIAKRALDAIAAEIE